MKRKVPNMIEVIENCDLCDRPTVNNTTILAAGMFDKYGLSFNVHTVLCKYCKYIFQQERIDRETLAHLYTQDNGYDSSVDVKQTKRFLDYKQKRQQTITAAIELVDLFDQQKLNILDVGGGIGEFTEHLVDRADVYLADVNTSDPISPKIVKLNNLLEDLETKVSFDVIVMNHVLEHVFSPTAFLQKAYSLLNDQGIVYIEVPFELYTPILFHRIGDWRHTAYFSRRVMTNFLRKVGFYPLHVDLCTGYYHTRQLTVIRGIAQKKSDAKLSNLDVASSYLVLLRDGLNLGALSNYSRSQLAKLSR